MDKYEIEIPLFRGFLDHEINLTDTLYNEFHSNYDYYRETYGKAMYISEDTIALRDCEYQKDICDLYIKLFHERFEQLHPGLIIEIEYKDLESPQFYQFDTDQLYVDVCLADDWRERLTSFMIQNQKWLNDRIREDWTSGSGFISNMSNKYDDWKKELEQLLPDGRYISELIGYMAEYAEPGFGKCLNDDVFNKVSISDYTYFIQAICVVNPECVFQPEEEGIIVETRDESRLLTSRTRIDDIRYSKILQTKATRHEYHTVQKNDGTEWHLTVYLYDDIDDVEWFRDHIKSDSLFSKIGLKSVDELQISKDGTFDKESWNIIGGKWAFLTNDISRYFVFEYIHVNKHGVKISKSEDEYYCEQFGFTAYVSSLRIADRIINLAGDIMKHKSIIVVSVEKNKMQIVDNKGKPLSGIYDTISVFDDNGMCMITRDGYRGMLNRKYEEQICCVYEDLSSFDQGLAIAKYKGRYGIINKNETEIVPFVMDYCEFHGFCNGYATMKDKNGKWGAIDREGNVVVPCLYAYAVQFDNKGLANVRFDRDDDKGFTINTKNERVNKK